MSNFFKQKFLLLLLVLGCFGLVRVPSARANYTVTVPAKITVGQAYIIKLSPGSSSDIFNVNLTCTENCVSGRTEKVIASSEGSFNNGTWQSKSFVPTTDLIGHWVINVSNATSSNAGYATFDIVGSPPQLSVSSSCSDTGAVTFQLDNVVPNTGYTFYVTAQDGHLTPNASGTTGSLVSAAYRLSVDYSNGVAGMYTVQASMTSGPYFDAGVGFNSNTVNFQLVTNKADCGGSGLPKSANSSSNSSGNPVNNNNNTPSSTNVDNNSASQGGIDLKIQDVEALIMGATCWIMRVSVAVMVLFILYTGFLFMSAQGVPAAQQKAQASLKYVLLGIAVIVGVYTIIGTVALAVGRNDFSFKTCSSVQ